eukprot:881911-Rhodomonas_salina.1
MLFEGLNDAANTNFVFNLGELMQTASGKDATTARDAMQKAEKMLKPLSLNFGDVSSFVKYLIACVGAEVVHCKSNISGIEGAAYSKADKWLVSLHYDCIALSIKNLEKAISIAEEHMQCADESPTKVKVGKTHPDTPSGTPDSGAKS